MGVDPQFAKPGQVAWPVPGGQQDDARGGQLGSLTDHGSHRQAIRVGHAGVQKYRGVRPAVGGAVLEGVHGRHPVAHRHGLHLPAVQPFLQDVAVTPAGGARSPDRWRRIIAPRVGSTAPVAGAAPEVLQFVADRRPSKEIGSIPCIFRRTADFHKARLVETLGVRYAMRRGISCVWPALRFAQRRSGSFASFFPAPGLLQLSSEKKRSFRRG